MPNLVLKDLEGHKQSLTALRGNIVVLSFWATWCGPCQEELPRLSRLSEAYAGKPVRFVAVSIDDNKTRSAIEVFLAKRGVHLETWTGATTDTMKKFSMGEIVPATIMIDELGMPIARISGEAQELDITSRLEWVLSGRLGPMPAVFVKRF